VCNQLHGFLVDVAGFLGVPPPSPESVPRENVTPDPDAGTLSSATLCKLQELTWIDQELYNSVRIRS
jgi:hypothetical protein